MNGLFYLIIVDSFTKWPEVLKHKRLTSTVKIRFLHELFVRFSYLETIVSDNTMLFMSKDFKMFSESFAINHITMPPFHPRSNGLAERFIDTLKRALKKYNGRDLKEIRIQHFLQVYHLTPNPSIVSGMLSTELMDSKKKTDTVKYFNLGEKIFFKIY